LGGEGSEESWVTGLFCGPGGPNVESIESPFNGRLRQLQDILAKDPKCLDFLSSNAIPAQALIDALIQNDKVGIVPILPTINNGILNITHAETNPPNSTLAIGVNPLGAYYRSNLAGFSLTVAGGNFTGGSTGAQLFILLHETGHLTGALQPDAGNSAASTANDKALLTNCKKAINQFGGH
jgi:hypothetical protein